ncbi:hypothetical protein EDB83DRAFT_2553729 [Lactarius deliciosus]|nr:hypothetical protein EDB83DRAFT_2553729 [Lactarius deliciosus]
MGRTHGVLSIPAPVSALYVVIKNCACNAEEDKIEDCTRATKEPNPVKNVHKRRCVGEQLSSAVRRFQTAKSPFFHMRLPGDLAAAAHAHHEWLVSCKLSDDAPLSTFSASFYHGDTPGLRFALLISISETPALGVRRARKNVGFGDSQQARGERHAKERELFVLAISEESSEEDNGHLACQGHSIFAMNRKQSPRSYGRSIFLIANNDKRTPFYVILIALRLHKTKTRNKQGHSRRSRHLVTN